MPEWLQSGTRRDICILLYGEEYQSQRLKSALAERYDRRIRPEQFRGQLSALVESGHIEQSTEGIADVYALTDAGEAALEDQFAWMRERVEGEA